MPVTKNQSTEILFRASKGESPQRVAIELGVTKEDFRAWRAENKEALFEAKPAKKKDLSQPPKANRLSRLQRRKVQLEERLASINAQIADVEGEEE